MLNRIYNVSKMEHPLSAFDKLEQFKGPLTENYVLQQMRGQFELDPRYYSDKTREIDFVIQSGMEIIPVEAKGGEGGKTDISQIFHYILQERQKTCCKFALRPPKDANNEHFISEQIPVGNVRLTAHVPNLSNISFLFYSS